MMADAPGNISAEECPMTLLQFPRNTKNCMNEIRVRKCHAQGAVAAVAQPDVGQFAAVGQGAERTTVVIRFDARVCINRDQRLPKFLDAARKHRLKALKRFAASSQVPHRGGLPAIGMSAFPWAKRTCIAGSDLAGLQILVS
jgi:hypothetical protein